MEAYLNIKILPETDIDAHTFAVAKCIANKAELTDKQISNLPENCQAAYQQLLNLNEDAVIETFSISTKAIKLHYVMNGLGYDNAEDIIAFWGRLGLGDTSAKLTHDDEGGEKPIKFDFRNGEVISNEKSRVDLSNLWKRGVLEPYWNDMKSLYQQLSKGGGAVRLRLELYPTASAEERLLADQRSKIKHLYSMPTGDVSQAERVPVKRIGCKFAYVFDLGIINFEKLDETSFIHYINERWGDWIRGNLPYETVKSFILALFRFDVPELVHPDSKRSLDVAFPFGLTKYGPGNYGSSAKAPFVMYSDNNALLGSAAEIVDIPAALERSNEHENAQIHKFLSLVSQDSPDLSALILAQYNAARFRSRFTGQSNSTLRFHIDNTESLTKIPATFANETKIKSYGNELHIKYLQSEDNPWLTYGVVIRDGYLSSFNASN